MQRKFELEIVSLSLFDPESELQQSLQLTDPIRKESSHLSFDFDAGRHLKLFDAMVSQTLPVQSRLHADLFPHSSQPIKASHYYCQAGYPLSAV